jgi:hypothetical protein
MVPIDIDDEADSAGIQAASSGGTFPNKVLRRWRRLRRLFTLPPAADTDTEAQLEGGLAALVAAGLIAVGDPVFAIGSYPQAHPAATVAEGGQLLAADGTLYPGPARLFGALCGERFAACGWMCLTAADGVRLEALRQRHLAETAPHLLAHGPGELAPLTALGVLATGDELRLQVTRPGGLGIGLPTVGLATVTEDGWFLLPEGDLYPTATSAAMAYLGPFITTGSWTTRDGRPLAVLHQFARDAARLTE